MPQMSPINWLSLFIIFSLTFIMFNMMNYYSYMPQMPKLFILQYLYCPSYNWKW